MGFCFIQLGMNHLQIHIRQGVYHLYAGKRLIASLQQKEIGEIVGCQKDRLLCLKGGKYSIRSLQGEEIEAFERYINPYPLRIPFAIDDWQDFLTANDEDEEARLRRTLRAVRQMSGESMEEKAQGMLALLEEADGEHELARLYRSSGKEWSCFVDKFSAWLPFAEDKWATRRELVSELLKGLARVL